MNNLSSPSLSPSPSLLPGSLVLWKNPKFPQKEHVHLVLDNTGTKVFLVPLSSKSLSFYWGTDFSSLPFSFDEKLFDSMSDDGYPMTDKLCWVPVVSKGLKDSPSWVCSDSEWNSILDSLESDLLYLNPTKGFQKKILSEMKSLYYGWLKSKE